MRRIQNSGLQAPLPIDPHCRRHAFQLIALLYGAAALADISCRYWP
jgi:hypothetical protein